VAAWIINFRAAFSIKYRDIGQSRHRFLVIQIAREIGEVRKKRAARNAKVPSRGSVFIVNSSRMDASWNCARFLFKRDKKASRISFLRT